MAAADPPTTEAILSMTIGEAARILKFTRRQMWSAVRRGEIPTLRIGDRVLVRTIPLDRLLPVWKD